MLQRTAHALLLATLLIGGLTQTALANDSTQADAVLIYPAIEQAIIDDEPIAVNLNIETQQTVSLIQADIAGMNAPTPEEIF